ncbi:hypothetical protein PVW48_02110 [Dinoroseobacter sp. PD6]|nr:MULTISPECIES: hypothetical protein [Dinoroseobacter]MDD9715524.1 hypothetical protein [Dinoroseobacter sp. PD6]URF48296.1 hypothetical protein M8008_08460 [Dinoroseobacter shibae]URF52606.1 hypothetical protein M8007_08460 [Dinoroseobacter shibae]
MTLPSGYLDTAAMLRPVAICALFALAPPALADVRLSYSDAGRTLFSFDVPAFWTVESGGERAITPPGEEIARTTPQLVSIRPTVDPTVWMGFFSPDGVRTVEEGVDYLSEIEKFLANEPEVTSVAPGRVGGLAAQIIKGSGRRDGQAITFTIAVVDLPGSRVAIAAGVAEARADPELVFEINSVFSSMRAGQ